MSYLIEDLRKIKLELISQGCNWEAGRIQAAIGELEANAAVIVGGDVGALERLKEAARPFCACVFNDNGDVTISTSTLNTQDWMRLDRAFIECEHPPKRG